MRPAKRVPPLHSSLVIQERQQHRTKAQNRKALPTLESFFRRHLHLHFYLLVQQAHQILLLVLFHQMLPTITMLHSLVPTTLKHPFLRYQVASLRTVCCHRLPASTQSGALAEITICCPALSTFPPPSAPLAPLVTTGSERRLMKAQTAARSESKSENDLIPLRFYSQPRVAAVYSPQMSPLTIQKPLKPCILFLYF